MAVKETITEKRRHQKDTMLACSLPSRFSLRVAGDAMQPFLPAEATAHFSLDHKPREGGAILIRVAGGEHYIREYRPQHDGSFLACATNQKYLPFDSAQEEIHIVAALTGVDYLDD